MENFDTFLKRINYQKAELQIEEGSFTPDGRLFEKVNPDNSFKAFFGDTVVFDLDVSTKEKVSEIIDRLYEAVPACFSERLRTDKLHMTLHDLSSSGDLGSVSSDVFLNELKMLQISEERPIQPQRIRMKTNFVINMVSTSLVLALVPADEGEWNKLQEIYDRINAVRVCPYPFLTPHITLAYFNYNGFDADTAQRLRAAALELNRNSFELTLDTGRLFYQIFTDMNHYHSVFALG